MVFVGMCYELNGATSKNLELSPTKNAINGSFSELMTTGEVQFFDPSL